MAPGRHTRARPIEEMGDKSGSDQALVATIGHDWPRLATVGHGWGGRPPPRLATVGSRLAGGAATVGHGWPRLGRDAKWLILENLGVLPWLRGRPRHGWP